MTNPLHISVKGNTIIEVLIALAITTFCISLSVIIYLNIQKSSLPFFRLKAMEAAELYMQKTIKENTFIEETYKAEEFSVKKTVALHELFADCYVIRMLVFDGSKKKIAELETIVHRAF